MPRMAVRTASTSASGSLISSVTETNGTPLGHAARCSGETSLPRATMTSGRSVSLKVSEKGGVSVYGLGRFPVTLYKEQWAKLLAMSDEIKAFLREHDAELKAKPEG